MREAQLDTAEEFDLLIVIICSRPSVRENLRKTSWHRNRLYLLLSCFSNCLKTWVFSVGSNNACQSAHFLCSALCALEHGILCEHLPQFGVCVPKKQPGAQLGIGTSRFA